MLLLPVGARVEIRASGQADAVDGVEDRLEPDVGHRGDDHRDAAGLLDRPDVGDRERELVRAWARECGIGRSVRAVRTSDVVRAISGAASRSRAGSLEHPRVLPAAALGAVDDE